MIFHRLRLINKKQRGFTLIELMLAIAISSVITGGITMTIFQVVEGSARTNNHMTAVRQVQNAGYWVSHDAVMAQIVELTPAPDPDGFPLALTWTSWDGNEVHQVVYSLVEDNKLQRSHSINLGEPTETVVAQYIDPAPAQTKCEFTNDALTFTVTATVGAGVQGQSETRTYKIVPRPGS